MAVVVVGIVGNADDFEPDPSRRSCVHIMHKQSSDNRWDGHVEMNTNMYLTERVGKT